MVRRYRFFIVASATLRGDSAKLVADQLEVRYPWRWFTIFRGLRRRFVPSPKRTRINADGAEQHGSDPC